MNRTIPPDWHLRSRLKARQLALLVAIAEHRSLRQAAQHIAVTQPAATRMLARARGRPRRAALRPLRLGHAGHALRRHDDPLRPRRADGPVRGARRDRRARVRRQGQAARRLRDRRGSRPRRACALRRAAGSPRASRCSCWSTRATCSAPRCGRARSTSRSGSCPRTRSPASSTSKPLRDEPLCLVARAGHPLARAKAIDIAALAGRTWILHPPESRMRADVNAMLARARLTLPGDVIETVSIVATLALLQGSDAVSVLPLDLALHYAELRIARATAARLSRRRQRDGAHHAREPPAGAGGPGLRGGAAESRAFARGEGRRAACSLPCDSCNDASQTCSTAMR